MAAYLHKKDMMKYLDDVVEAMDGFDDDAYVNNVLEEAYAEYIDQTSFGTSAFAEVNKTLGSMFDSYTNDLKVGDDTTAAFDHLSGIVSETIKAGEQSKMKQAQRRLSQLAYGYSRKMVGTMQRCLVTGVSKKDPGQLQARTICDRVVNFRSDSIDLVGQLINIRINDALPNSLRGSIEN